jgi:hypothetical protein
MKWSQWFRVAGVILFLAITLFGYGGTAAASPVSTPGMNNPAMVSTFTHTFILHHNGAAVVETCVGDTGITKSQSYPGFIAGTAFVASCSPDAAVDCSQQVELFFQDPGFPWRGDGMSSIVHGCTDNLANLRKNCTAAPEDIGYHALGIFTATDTNGDHLTWSGNSPNIVAKRIC